MAYRPVIPPQSLSSSQYDQDYLNDNLLAANPTPRHQSATQHGLEWPPPTVEPAVPVQPTLPVQPPPYVAGDLHYSGTHRLVIAIDYGTTFTGVAYTTPSSNRASLPEITTVSDWGPGMGNHPKIPSVISYTPPGTTGKQQWGASLSGNAITMINTKLELDIQDSKADELELILQVLTGTGNLHFDSVRASGSLPEYTWKEPEDIVTDYLTRIFECVRPLFDNYGTPLRSQLPVDIVITVPVSWSYQAKNSTLRAIHDAGFNTQTFPNLADVMLVSEPEAAAIYTARHLKEETRQQFLKLGECFVLCDAGGGTVDLVAYRVTKLDPTLELEQLTIATSAKCGSTYIDAQFKRWLYKIIGKGNFLALESSDAGEQIGAHTVRQRRMRKLIQNFEEKKKKFSNSQAGHVNHVALPEPLHELNIPGKVVDGELYMTFDEMKGLFNPCVDRVVQMIQAQIYQVEHTNNRVKNVFLVGGFGESPYLREELAKSLLIRRIAIRQPVSLKSWTAVVQGACIYGAEKNNRRKSTSVIKSARSIGIALNERYSALRNVRQDMYQDRITRANMAMGQLHWLVRRGDLLPSGISKTIDKRFSFVFWRTTERRSRIPVYAYSAPDDDVPDRLQTGRNELTEVAHLNCDLSHISLSKFERVQNSGSKAYYVANLDCKIVLSGSVLSFDVHHKGQKVCTAQVRDLAGSRRLQDFDDLNQDYYSDDYQSWRSETDYS